MMYVFAIGGLGLLFLGGEWLVRGAVAVSRRFGLSPLLIGMTIVAGCTAAPELVVSLDAALSGSSDIALGNVLGSNIFNVLAVIGVSALVVPIVVRPIELRRDLGVMLASALVVALLAQWGEIGRVVGAIMMLGLVVYIVVSYRWEASHPGDPSAELHEHEAEEFATPPSLRRGAVYLAVGLASLVLGARLLVDGATAIARGFGVSEAIIGLSLVALGTSLPELATSIVAAVRRHADVAVGNVVGSNIFNVLAILGTTAVVRPIDVAERIARVDVWVALAVSAALAVVLLIRGRVGRVLGACFLGGYVAYLATLVA
jgi:cation:H+ antiporter